MAASLRSNEDFSRLWELAVMELSEPLSMRSIARSGVAEALQETLAEEMTSAQIAEAIRLADAWIEEHGDSE